MASQSKLLVLMLARPRAVTAAGSFVEKNLRIGLEGLTAGVGTEVEDSAVEVPLSRSSRRADCHTAYRVFVMLLYFVAFHAESPIAGVATAVSDHCTLLVVSMFTLWVTFRLAI